jgi:inosine-uridine nucleoside N-ribohydrolase
MMRFRPRLLPLLSCLLALLCAGSCLAQGSHRKVIFDEDTFGPGGSNMQAVLLLLQARDVDLLGITVVSGDGWRDEEVSQTLRLLEIAQRPDVPVIPGAVLPLLNTPERTRRWETLYGKLYYKGAWMESHNDDGTTQLTPRHPDDPYRVPPSPEGTPKLLPSKETAAAFLVRQVREHPGEVTILAGGPLTDLALAVRLDPQLPQLAKELVFMGGSYSPQASNNAFAEEYANAPRLEFNMRFDPEAASLVLHEPWKRIVQVPVDPTTPTFFRPELIKQVAAGKAPFAAYIGRFGQSFPMWDELAVAVWLDPTLIRRSATLAVDIDTSFTASYGDTLSWSPGRGPGLGERPVQVVLEADVPRFEQLVLSLLTAPGARH